ncbi:hypothetical protein DFS34DRAFT_619384 [Phlyctochytrium arcticum]|nr:hypothetical protein DFS34DRAFT_619384 [Phlyctochytrium arcticum]
MNKVELGSWWIERDAVQLAARFREDQRVLWSLSSCLVNAFSFSLALVTSAIEPFKFRGSLGAIVPVIWSCVFILVRWKEPCVLIRKGK